MKKLERIFAFLFIYIFLINQISITIRAAEVEQAPGVSSAHFIMSDSNSGTVFLKSDENTKINGNIILPLLVSLTVKDKLKVDDLALVTDKSVEVYNQFVKEYPKNVIEIKKGERLKVSDLLKSILLTYSQDSISVLAIQAAGSEEEFLKLVNEKIKSLGLENTSLNSLYLMKDMKNTTSLNDLVKVMREFSKDKELVSYGSISEFTIPANNMFTETRTVYSLNSQASSGNENYTESCKISLMISSDEYGKFINSYVGLFEEGDQSYIVAFSDVQDAKTAYIDSSTLSKWALKNYKSIRIIDKGAVISKHVLTETQSLPLLAKEDFYVLKSVSESKKIPKPSFDIKPVQNLDNQINQGDILSSAQIKIGEETVGSIDLVASESVDMKLIQEANNQKTFFGKLIRFLKSIFVTLIILALVLAIYKVIFEMRRTRERRKKRIKQKEEFIARRKRNTPR